MRTPFQFNRSQFDLVDCNLAFFQFILLQFKLMGNWLKFWLSCTEANSCSDLRCSCSPAARSVPLPDSTVPRNSAKVSPNFSIAEAPATIPDIRAYWCKCIVTRFLCWISERSKKPRRRDTTEPGHRHIRRWLFCCFPLAEQYGGPSWNCPSTGLRKVPHIAKSPQGFKYFA